MLRPGPRARLRNPRRQAEAPGSSRWAERGAGLRVCASGHSRALGASRNGGVSATRWRGSRSRADAHTVTPETSRRRESRIGHPHGWGPGLVGSAAACQQQKRARQPDLPGNGVRDRGRQGQASCSQSKQILLQRPTGPSGKPSGFQALSHTCELGVGVMWPFSVPAASRTLSCRKQQKV